MSHPHVSMFRTRRRSDREQLQYQHCMVLQLKLDLYDPNSVIRYQGIFEADHAFGVSVLELHC